MMIMIGFKCLGSSCLDLGLASAPDCLASVSTSMPRSRSCLASVLAVTALPLPLPRKLCLGICLCLEKNALTTTLLILNSKVRSIFSQDRRQPQRGPGNHSLGPYHNFIPYAPRSKEENLRGVSPSN